MANSSEEYISVMEQERCKKRNIPGKPSYSSWMLAVCFFSPIFSYLRESYYVHEYVSKFTRTVISKAVELGGSSVGNRVGMILTGHAGETVAARV
jgi:hypothetical protein